MADKIYYTTTLPYVNSDPHIGFAAEIIRADIFARHQRLLGHEVFFNTGTDEHGQKIFQKAQEAGQETQDYVDVYAEKFRRLKNLLNLSDLNFIRTTDPEHIEAAQAFWRLCDQGGYIYKKAYKVKYCVGCELEKTDSELENGRCPLHRDRELDEIEEENYFFKFSAFGDRLLKLYVERPDFVVPDFRFNEIKAFVVRGLQDFSISRLKSKMPWGIPVPDDAEQVMYVWFDALVNYVSAIGWPQDMSKFNQWWPVVQFCGKDNLRQQAAMWQAMLMAADLPPSKQVVINGFIMSDGQKMSKSLGNVINPAEIVAEYGAEAFRFYIAQLEPFEDSDVTPEKIKDVYNGELANGVGNLASRLLKMAANYGVKIEVDFSYQPNGEIEQYRLHSALSAFARTAKELDNEIQKREPFKVFKTDPDQAKKDVAELLNRFGAEVVTPLTPFMPTTCVHILEAINRGETLGSPLFPRID